jgi:hypothetical protein
MLFFLCGCFNFCVLLGFQFFPGCSFWILDFRMAKILDKKLTRRKPQKELLIKRVKIEDIKFEYFCQHKEEFSGKTPFYYFYSENLFITFGLTADLTEFANVNNYTISSFVSSDLTSNLAIQIKAEFEKKYPDTLFIFEYPTKFSQTVGFKSSFFGVQIVVYIPKTCISDENIKEVSLSHMEKVEYAKELIKKMFCVY